ncbi:tRNA lysidine(34) synthetase TilS [Caproicibacterium argilliputei]|uniref:tRNA(Ile)-lysidine synthase n=1 Tax=Caproicibacterium argilliputei TaxID=3030016 RepID=A0AA97D9S5_9FIRM|nr:tRNA lysidine(34) synthetase TilS [Caproicibacterium argilliputei]WOC33230.1 tRNA lysidine(34) synthetase TilS [Caproicibacterium argilliputei]
MEQQSMDSLVFHTLSQHRMLRPGMVVVTGFSGGADSTALLHWLAAHAEKLEVQVLAAHVNHGLRGAEAVRDEQAVRHFCAERQIPLRVLRADVRAEARKTGEGLEECGRRLRYAFFYEICRQYPNACIATAHTLSDCAETVLLNLARGAGAAGLAGIPPVRGKIIRPLLAVSRAQTEAYCRENGLAFVTDSSNADLTFARNRVRALVVPQLRQVNPAFERAAGRAAETLREDEACLREFARQALEQAACHGGWRAEVLAKQPRAVRMRALSLAAEAAGAGRLSCKHLDALDTLLRHGGGCTLPGACCARVEQGVLLFPQAAQGYRLPLQVPQTALPDGRVLCVSVLSRTAYEQEKRKLSFSNCLNYGTITSDTVVRTRKSGDFFHPAGRNGTKSLKKLLNEQHIPASLRGRLAMLADSSGILWIEGCGPSEKAKVTPAAQQIAVVTMKECLKNGEPDAR